jgi:ATP-binding cassette subfamily B protein
MRFYQPENGQIILDGHNIEELDVQSLRRSIGLMSQDVFLLHGTSAENVTSGRPGATLDDIIAACKKAEAHEFIMTLEKQYDTIVGERGHRLSGGQRQRIAFARAVLRDAPILILDEATSAIDNETERAIQKSLKTISKDKTTIIIAHRLSTVRHADCIYVVKNGSVTEKGSHEDLLKTEGIYNDLWSLQIGGRL